MKRSKAQNKILLLKRDKICSCRKTYLFGLNLFSEGDWDMRGQFCCKIAEAFDIASAKRKRDGENCAIRSERRQPERNRARIASVEFADEILSAIRVDRSMESTVSERSPFCCNGLLHHLVCAIPWMQEGTRMDFWLCNGGTYKAVKEDCGGWFPRVLRVSESRHYHVYVRAVTTYKAVPRLVQRNIINRDCFVRQISRDNWGITFRGTWHTTRRMCVAMLKDRKSVV